MNNEPVDSGYVMHPGISYKMTQVWPLFVNFFSEKWSKTVQYNPLNLVSASVADVLHLPFLEPIHILIL